MSTALRGEAGAVLLAFCFVACTSVTSFDDEPTWQRPEQGAVVSEHPLATEVGLQILERGGNAADAAVACALALAVVYPQAGNLGGGGFALWVPHEGEAAALDFRETAPTALDASLYLNESGELVPERSLATPLAVGVPGSPAGLYELYRSHGSRTLSFAELCAAAVELAEDGFRVDDWLARDLRQSATRTRLEGDPAARALFYPGGTPLDAGDTLRQPVLADTLRRLARGGPDAFYKGPVARAIVLALAAADLRHRGVAQGALLSLGDLAAYTVRERDPVVGWFRGSEVISVGPPSAGGVVLLQVLAMLDGFPLDAERRLTIEARGPEGAGLSARALHWWIEAMRRAFADRAEHLGDPDFYDVPMQKLLSPKWLAQRRISIGERANPTIGALVPDPPPESSETTHVSVLDRRGNAVSLTTTLNTSFGSGILVPDGGFLLNNELDDFALAPNAPNVYDLVGGEANAAVPGKRPLSSMTPTVLRDGGRRVSIVVGSPGGPRIISSVVQVLLRVLVYGQTLVEAVRAPRLHQQWRPTATRFEGRWDPALADDLEREHGHEIEWVEGGRFGSVQAIRVNPTGEVEAVSDPRRGGAAGLEGEPLPMAAPAIP